MTRTCKKLIAGIVPMLAVLLCLLIVHPAAVKASASDTSLVLDQDERVLGTNAFKTGQLTGKISGDTSSTYYIYAIPADESIVKPQEGFTMTSNSFSFKVTGLKAGKTSVRLSIKDTKKGVVVASGSVQITVKSLDLSGCYIQPYNFTTSGISGNTCTGLLRLYNLPAGISFSCRYEMVNKNNTLAAEWITGYKRGTNYQDKELKLIYLKPGTEQLKLSLIDLDGNIIKSTSFKVTSSYSMYDEYKTYTINVDLAKSSEFKIYPRISSTTLQRKAFYTLPKTITCKSSTADNWCFKASATGTYTLSVYEKICYKDKWYEVGRINYTIKVTNSKPVTTTSTTKKVTTTTATTKTTAKIITTTTSKITTSTSKTTTTTTTTAPKPIPLGSYKGNTYQLYSGVVKSWEEAKSYCEKIGGHLAVINDADENAYLYQYMKDCSYTGAYFGLVDEKQNGSWKWVYGNSTYFNWAEGEPSDADEPYGMFFYKFTDGTWNDAKWGDNTKAFICEWETGSKITSAPPTSYNGNVYQVFSGAADSWEEAKAYCESLGGHLAVISSQEENDYLYQYITENGYTGAYFGLADPFQSGNWIWVNGTSNFTNWHKGEPSDMDEPYGMFFYEFEDGTWNDAKWGDNTEAFICEWEVSPAVTDTTQPTDLTNTATLTEPTTSTTAPEVENYSLEMEVDEEVELGGAAEDGFTYENSEPEILYVNENGYMLALNEGDAVISVSLNGTLYIRIYVHVSAGKNSGIEEYTLEMEEGGSFSLDELMNESVTFESSDPEIAEVDENGLITAIQEGETIIFVYTDDIETIRIYLDVYKSGGNNEDNEVVEYEQGLFVGESICLTEIWDNFDAVMIDNEDVVTLGDNYELTACTEGEATVSIFEGDKEIYRLYVTVTVPEENEWEDRELELEVGEAFALDEDSSLHYVSEDEEIAYIVEDAFIVAYQLGRTQINVLRGDDVLYTINVTVTGEINENPELEEYDIMLFVGEDTSLEDLYQDGVTCLSSDPSVASITEDFRLAAHKEGITTITMQLNGETIYKLKLKVFINDEEEETETTASAVTTSETTTTTSAVSLDQDDTTTSDTTTTATGTTASTTGTTSTTSATSDTTTTTTETQTPKGDVNGDGSVNLKDVVVLRRYIAGGWNVILDTSTADINGDGSINLKDVVMLRRMIAGGWEIK